MSHTNFGSTNHSFLLFWLRINVLFSSNIYRWS